MLPVPVGRVASENYVIVVAVVEQLEGAGAHRMIAEILLPLGARGERFEKFPGEYDAVGVGQQFKKMGGGGVEK